MPRGLVLEGGAMRGLFSAGVLDFLMKEKIEFDAIAGVSAGAAYKTSAQKVSGSGQSSGNASHSLQ